MLESLLQQWGAQSWLELIAVVLALAYVWLAARQSIWCWPCALISTSIYVWLFWEVTLPFHAMLNGYYMLMAVYGFVQWRSKGEEQLPVSQWPIGRHLTCCSLLLLISLALASGAASVLDADYLYLDAGITVFSLFTTVLVAHKVLENWLYWLVINCAACWLYFAKGLPLTGLLYLAYFGFAIYGYWQWQKQLQLQQQQQSYA